jgi:hypothetical protein
MPEYLGLCQTCAERHPEHRPAVAIYWTLLGGMCAEHFATYEQN